MRNREATEALTHKATNSDAPTSPWPFTLPDRTLESLTDAETALRDTKDAATAYHQGRKRLRPAGLRDRLDNLVTRIEDEIEDLSSPELMLVNLRLAKAGVDWRRLRRDHKVALEVVQKLRDDAAAATSKKREADINFEVLLRRLAAIFERFSRSTSRVDFFTKRLRFLEVALDAAGIDRPEDLCHRMRGLRPPRSFVGEK